MAVRQLDNGKWIADVVVGSKWNGTPDRRTQTVKTKALAEKEERKLLLIKEANKGRAADIKFRDFLEEYYWPNKTLLRDNTREGYERDIRLRLMPAFGDMYISDIKKSHIQSMLSHCATRKVATNARETLSSILGQAYDLEMIPRNPASLRYSFPREIPKADGEEDSGEWLTSFEDHVRLINHAREHAPEAVFRTIVVGLCFGLRKGEIFGLDWETIDFDKNQIRIVQTYTYAKGQNTLNPPKTEKSIRYIPITKYARKFLEEWYKTDKKGAVIKSVKGQRVNPHTANNAMKLFVEKNAVPRVTIASLRHSFATASIRGGIDVASVSKWLGHTDISTTYNRYVKPTLNNLHDDAKKIDAIYEKAQKTIAE